MKKYNSLNEIKDSTVEAFKEFCLNEGWNLKKYKGDLSQDIKTTILRWSGGSITAVRLIATKIAAANLYAEKEVNEDSFSVICDKINAWLKECA